MKVFQIGFNKCATLSLHTFFKNNGHSSVHWDGGKWNKIFHKNHIKGNLLCNGHDDIIFWSDLTYIQRHFETFAVQYPSAKFIYNTRNIDDWIESRKRHYSPKGIERIWMKENKLRENKIKHPPQHWRSEWVIYERRLLEYFSGIHRNRLLIFDIDSNTSQDIVNFLPELNFNNLKFPHKHKSKK